MLDGLSQAMHLITGLRDSTFFKRLLKPSQKPCWWPRLIPDAGNAEDGSCPHKLAVQPARGRIELSLALLPGSDRGFSRRTHQLRPNEGTPVVRRISLPERAFNLHRQPLLFTANL